MVRSRPWGEGGRTGRPESHDLPFLLSLSLGPSSCNSWLLVDDSSPPYAQVLSRTAYLFRNEVLPFSVCSCRKNSEFSRRPKGCLATWPKTEILKCFRPQTSLRI